MTKAVTSFIPKKLDCNYGQFHALEKSALDRISAMKDITSYDDLRLSHAELEFQMISAH